MNRLLCGLLLLVSALAHSTLAGAASVVLGQAGASGVSAIISPDPGEIGRPANIWMGGVLNGALYLRNGPSTWAEYRGGPFPIALTNAALPSSLQVSIVNIDVSSVPGLDVYVGYGTTEADLSLNGHLAKVYTTVPTPAATAVGVATGSAASATIGAAGGSVSSPEGKIALTIPAGALASNTVIGIQPLTNMAHGKIGAAYRLTPEGQTFLAPVTLTFAYTDQDLLGTAVEVLGAAFQTADGYWQWGGTATVDTTAKTVSVSSSHFSVWSLVKELQIQPASKTVKVMGSVGLEVVSCYDPPSPDPRGYKCDLGDEDLAPLLPRSTHVSEWSVNGVLGGGGTKGTVSGSGATATYTAPATKPNPNTVAVSARVDRGATVTRVVSNITIADDFWSGTATGTETSSVMSRTSAAQVTWNLIGTVDNVSVYTPTGIVSAAITTLVGCSDSPSLDPSSHVIDSDTDGLLTIDFNTTPPTYHGAGLSTWPATLTCTDNFGHRGSIPGFSGETDFFGGNGGPLGVEAVGVVSPDGVTIAGSSTGANGLQTFTWRFTRNQ